MLDVRDVTVAFGGPPVLDAVSLTVADGEVVALLGPSGSGKSTLLRVVAGLVPPDAGRVLLDGEDITARPTHRRGVGMVFQDEQLFPHRDVAANVEFGLRMLPRRPSAHARAQRVSELLAVVGLSGFEHRRVTELSGGEAKRVALARSLAPAPRVVLLDEPLTGLDRELHDHLAGELARILRETATTSLLVTHDRDEAAAVADRVVRMSDLSVDIVELRAEETHPLRAAVLRNGTPSTELRWAADDDATTSHLGAASRWRPDRHRDVGVEAVSRWGWRCGGATARDGGRLSAPGTRSRRAIAGGGCGQSLRQRRDVRVGQRP